MRELLVKSKGIPLINVFHVKLRCGVVFSSHKGFKMSHEMINHKLEIISSNAIIHKRQDEVVQPPNLYGRMKIKCASIP